MENISLSSVTVILNAAKTILARIIALLMFLLPAHPEQLMLSMPVPVTTESETMTIEYKNTTNRTVEFSEFNTVLEVFENDEWCTVPVSADFVHHEMMTVVPPMGGGSITIDIALTYGHKLAEGNYRLTLKYGVSTQIGETLPQRVNMSSSVEFTVY